MIVFRRRLIFWLVKAYFKRWGRLIIIFFVLGLFGFFALRYAAIILPSKFPLLSRKTIGLTGTYTVDSLPTGILDKISRGLTKIGTDGSIHPDTAYKWKIEEDGKKYTFYLKNNIYFSDGTRLTSKQINYNFKDAKTFKPDDYTLVFKLKDAYSPFLITVSRPIFKEGFVGVGEYRIRDLKLNGSFVSSLDLSSENANPKILKYLFYPTEDSLKTSFMLGEVSQINGLHDINFNGESLSRNKSLKIEKKFNQNQLVSVFYNTSDPVMSDKKIREALTYATPDEFSNGKRNFSPFSPSSWAYSEIGFYIQDFQRSRNLISQTDIATKSSVFNLKTLPQYENIAKVLQDNYKKINVNVKIYKVDSIPDNFQIFIGDFNLSKDPDQYLLWHSNQDNNITNYKNLRIDKLLEDGRKTVNTNERKKIYSDFQKYLLDDSPATFLYLPYTYTISRN